MSTPDAAATVWGAGALGEQRRALDTAWLGALATLAAGATASWLTAAPAADLTRVFGWMFVCASLALALETGLDWVVALTGRQALSLAHAQRFLWLAALWHFAGGIDAPTLLLAFGPPLSVAGFLRVGRLPAVSAAVAIVGVAVVSLVESPELRWFLLQMGAPDMLFTSLPVVGRVSEMTEVASPELQFATVATFTAMSLIAAWVSFRVARRTDALGERLRPRVEEPAVDPLRGVLRDNPVPSVLVYADDGQIVSASRSFQRNMLVHRETVPVITLFECLSFADPSRIRRILEQPSGDLTFEQYRIGTEWRTARITAHQVVADGVRYAVVSFHDEDALYYLSRATDQIADPLLIIRAEREIVYFNAPAARLCPFLHYGMDPAHLLTAEPGDSCWWCTSCTTPLAIGGRSFLVESTQPVPSGSTEPLTLVRLRAAPTSAERPKEGSAA